MIIKTVKFQNTNNLSVDYFIGRSAKNNFHIIDAAQSHDLWFHINGQPSGHVIASIPENLDKTELRYVIKQGAVLCKQYSKFASHKNVEIVYARVANVQKCETLGSVSLSGSKVITI